MGEGNSQKTIKTVLGAKTLYNVLGLPPTCTADEIKKKYRKMAIIVHPDRCKHPRATEAFQRISEAYETLSDDDQRADYDRSIERPKRQQPYAQWKRQGDDYVFEFGNLSAQDLYDLFSAVNRQQFAGNFRESQNRYEGWAREEPEQELRWSWHFVLWILPFILLAIVGLFYDAGPRWGTIIQFDEPLDETLYKSLKTPIFGKTFGISREYLLKESRFAPLGPAFYQQVKDAAEELWIQRLRKECKKSGGDSTSCTELHEHEVDL
jgi:hypothetical protein